MTTDDPKRWNVYNCVYIYMYKYKYKYLYIRKHYGNILDK